MHGSGSVPGIKIDWDVPVELSGELQAAMAPHDLTQMHLGVLRRGYAIGSLVYPRGTLACRVAEGHEIFLQRPPNDVPRAVPVAPSGSWTVETLDAGGPGKRAPSVRHRIVVDPRRDGTRVDATIASVVPSISRALAQRLIDEGQVCVAGLPIKKANQRIHTGDVLEVLVMSPVGEAEPVAEREVEPVADRGP